MTRPPIWQAQDEAFAGRDGAVRGNLNARAGLAAAGDSRALVRRVLLQAGALSRAELAERTGLSRPAITDICQELLELGQIRETGARTPGRSAVGRRRVQLDLNPTAGYALGVLVAAENSAITILDLKGRLVATRRVQPPSTEPDAVLAYLAAAGVEQLQAAGIPRERLAGVGVTVPGIHDPRSGSLRLSPFFGWADVPVRATFEAVFGPRVSVAGPVRAIAVAEMLLGSAAGLARTDLLLVNVSTGIGAAFVLGGRLQRGADDASGQVGHVIVQPDGRQCNCGRRGCLDAVASGDALLAIAAEQGLDYGSFSGLLAAARTGDAAALALLDGSARSVGTLVGDLITTLNPAVVTVTGMVLQMEDDWYVERVRAAALERAWVVGDAPPRIVPSAFGVEAGAVGAAAIALEDQVYATWRGGDTRRD